MWSELVSWVAIAIYVPLFIGLGIGVLSMSPPEYLIAKVCFTAAALILLCKVSWWLASDQPPQTTPDKIVAFVIFGVLGSSWLTAFLWVNTKERIQEYLTERRNGESGTEEQRHTKFETQDRAKPDVKKEIPNPPEVTNAPERLNEKDLVEKKPSVTSATLEVAKVRKYSAEGLKRRRELLDAYAEKINGPVLSAFREGRKLWDDWNNSQNQISKQQFLDRLTNFKRETMEAFEQIDELWRKYRFDYPEITQLTDWTNNRVLEKTNLLLSEIPRFAQLNETDARAAMMNNRFVDDWYGGINEFDQWIIAKRKVIAEKRREYEAAEVSADDVR